MRVLSEFSPKVRKDVRRAIMGDFLRDNLEQCISVLPTAILYVIIGYKLAFYLVTIAFIIAIVASVRFALIASEVLGLGDGEEVLVLQRPVFSLFFPGLIFVFCALKFYYT